MIRTDAKTTLKCGDSKKHMVPSDSLKLSYSQNGEDIVLERAFSQKKSGFYIDIGAYDPTEDSVTKFFYDKGWHGINIEPLTHNYTQFVKARKRDKNLNLAIGAKASELTFYECQQVPGWSTLSTKVMTDLENQGTTFVKRPVKVITLAQLFTRYVGDKQVDFLKIDAEGSEAQIILNYSWTEYRPIILVIEKNDCEKWEPYLLEHRYIYALDDGINRFYVRQENIGQTKLLCEPANIKDKFIKYSIFVQLEENRRNLDRVTAELNKKNRCLDAIFDDQGSVIKKILLKVLKAITKEKPN